jgi:DNA-binding LacI/PurR family transcriptional regulator
MLHVFNHALDRRLAEWNLPTSVMRSLEMQRTKLAGIAIPEDQDSATQQLIRRAIDESFVSGFRIVMAIGAALAIASAATALIFIGAPRDSRK